MKNIIIIFIIITISILALVFVNSYTNATQEEAYLGPVTIIPQNKTPIDAMRNIYLEFTRLENPVLKRIIFHKAKKKYNFEDFSLHSYQEPSYYEYILTDQAKVFISKHTGAEITASLMPIVMHPRYGGEAAVIITSILSHSTLNPSYPVSSISSQTSTFLHSTGYRSPSEMGNWNQKVSHKFKIGHWGYITLKSTPKFVKQIVVKNSLHHQLLELSNKNFYYTHAPKHPRTRPKIIDDANSVEEWLNKHPFPAYLDLTTHNEITNKFGNDFTILGLYPDQINRSFLYYNLNLKKYWPVIFGYPQTNNLPGTTGRFRRESRKRWDLYKKEYSKQLKREIFKLVESSYEKK